MRRAILLLACAPALVYLWLSTAEAHSFKIDWDTASYAAAGFETRAAPVTDGTHLLLGWVYAPAVLRAATLGDVLENLRVLFRLAGGLVFFFLLWMYRELFEGRVWPVALSLLFSMLLPAFQFVYRSFDDNVLSYAPIALSAAIALTANGRAWRAALAGFSACFAVLLGQGFASYILIPASLVLTRTRGNEVRLLIVYCVAAVSGFVLLGGLHQLLSGAPVWPLLTTNYTVQYFPEASWQGWAEMLRYTWTESLTGCQHLDCSRFSMETGIPPRTFYSRADALGAKLLALLFCVAAISPIITRDVRRIAVSMTAALVLLVGIGFIAYTKSFDVNERYDGLIFCVPLFLYAADPLPWLRRTISAFMIAVILCGFSLFVRSMFMVPPQSKFAELARAERKELYFFSSREIPKQDRGIWFHAVASLPAVEVVDFGEPSRLPPLRPFISRDEALSLIAKNSGRVYISPDLAETIGNRKAGP